MIDLSQPLALLPEAVDAVLAMMAEADRAPPDDTVAAYDELSDEDRRRLIDGYRWQAGQAVIPVVGPVASDSYFGTSWRRVTETIEAVLEEPGLASAVLWIDSPGGAVGGISGALEALARLKARVPVYVVIGGTCASAAYWFASGVGRGRIYASPEAVVGGVGALLYAYKDEGSYRVRFVSKRTPRKGADPATAAGKADRQQLVDDCADLFLTTVASNRGIRGSLDEVAVALGEGAVFSAQRALERGLVDEIRTATKPSARRQGVFAVDAVDLQATDTDQLFAAAEAATHQPGPGRGGTMDPNDQAATSAQAAQAVPKQAPAAKPDEIVALQAERDALQAERDALRAERAALQARIDDERQQRASLAERVDALSEGLKAEQDARKKSESELALAEANRTVDAMVVDGFPEARRDSAVKAYLQHKAGDSAWWDDLQASFDRTASASHLRGRETHGGKPPQAKKGADRDEKVKAYMDEHKCSPVQAMAALGIG